MSKMMGSMRKRISKNIIVISLLVLIAGSGVIYGITELNGGNKMTVDLVDENGNVIPPLFSWYAGETQASGVKVTLSWSITGTEDIVWTTLSVAPLITIFVRDVTAGGDFVEKTATVSTYRSSEKVYSLIWNLPYFENLLGVQGDVRVDYEFRFDAVIRAEVEDTMGRMVYPEPWTDSDILSVYWDPQLQSIQVVGILKNVTP